MRLMPTPNHVYTVVLAAAGLTCFSSPGYAQPTTTRVSVSSGGPQADGPSIGPALSADGRYVAFESSASTLVAGDTNGTFDVFVHDRQVGVTTRVSVSSAGDLGNNYSSEPDISADGQFVAFHSGASNLVAGDTNGTADVFVHDRQTGATTRVSVSSAGGQGNGESGGYGGFAISADGRVVAFHSLATNLVAGDTNGVEDIFVHDRQTGLTTRVSVSSTGVQANGSSQFPAISGEGRFVAFWSNATNLVAGDTNGSRDIFVHDRQTGLTTRVSVSSAGVQGNAGSSEPAISEDGRFVAFWSAAFNLEVGDTNGTMDVFVHDRHTGTTKRVSISSAGGQANSGSGHPVISADGRFVAFWSRASNLVTGDTNGFTDVFVHDRQAGTTTRVSVSSAGGEGNNVSVSSALSADGRLVAFDSSASNLVAGDTNGHHDVFVHDRQPQGVGSDNDGLPDEWELQFGLNPHSADGDDGPDGDPDGDGVTNREEFQRGTHPRGFFTRYLAEGATGTFFDTRLALANPTDTPALVLLRYQKSSGETVPQFLTLAPFSRATVDVASVAGLDAAEFSTVVEADVEIVVDRTMTWDSRGYGAHAERGISTAAATTWYFAEGATHSGFALFYLIQNPSDQPAAVEVTYLRPAPAPPLVKTYTVGPHTRFNIWVNNEAQTDPHLAPLAATDLSAIITSVGGVPIIAERAMYLHAAGVPFGAGHESAGVTAPSTSWFLAEGATGDFFDMFVLIANPTHDDAIVQASFLLPSGEVIVKQHQVAARSRFNIWVDAEDPRLADTAVSTTITSLNDVPIVVERAMWWPGQPSAAAWHEAHNSPGSTTTGTRWAVAEGETGGPRGVETYLLIANTSSVHASVRVTLLFEDATTAVQTFDVLPNSRFNVAPAAMFPESAGRRYGALIESVGETPAEIVVERAMYWDALGRRWAAGTNALGTRLQ